MSREDCQAILSLCDIDEVVKWVRPAEFILFPPSAAPFVKRLFAPNRSESQRESDLRKILRRLNIDIDEVSFETVVEQELRNVPTHVVMLCYRYYFSTPEYTVF